jgi:PPOX class probable F420-dependent enzyme
MAGMEEPRSDRPHMPGYGIEPTAEGLLPWQWAVDRLVDAHTYMVASVRPDGAPHIVPVWAVWHDGMLAFATAETSRKAVNLRGEPRCAVTVEHGLDTVIVEGRAAVISGPADPIRQRYEEKYGERPPDDSPLIGVTPVVIFGFTERDGEFTRTATRWRCG